MSGLRTLGSSIVDAREKSHRKSGDNGNGKNNAERSDNDTHDLHRHYFHIEYGCPGGLPHTQQQKKRERYTNIRKCERVDDRANMFSADPHRSHKHRTPTRGGVTAKELTHNSDLRYRNIVKHTQRAYHDTTDKQCDDIESAPAVEVEVHAFLCGKAG
jgi:hypothetical protein